MDDIPQEDLKEMDFDEQMDSEVDDDESGDEEEDPQEDDREDEKEVFIPGKHKLEKGEELVRDER